MIALKPMKCKNIPAELLEAFRTNQHFLLIVHQKPDGDAIGSLVALGRALKAMNREVDYVVDLPLEANLTFFEECRYFEGISLKSDYDVVVYLDCASKDHAFVPEQEIGFKTSLLIDHHRTNQGYCDINFIEETGATGELVFRIIEALEVPFDDEMCAAIFTALSTDTGSFQFSNVTTNTHEIAGKLYELGKSEDYAVLSKKLHKERSFEQMKLYGAAIDRLMCFADGKIAWLMLDKETIDRFGGESNIVDEVSNLGVNLHGTVISALLKQRGEGCFKVSLRSRSPYPVDVSKLAEKYGGGGHMRAAGLTYEGDPEVFKQMLVDFLAEQEL